MEFDIAICATAQPLGSGDTPMRLENMITMAGGEKSAAATKRKKRRRKAGALKWKRLFKAERSGG
jgi:hypothetical protein